jgi:oxygen-independent coproporphyrinogen-3 oxidase
MAVLYLHVPFLEPPSPDEESAFATAVIREVERYARPRATDTDLQTLYVGGGRPSVLSVSTLRSLIQAIRQTLNVTRIEEGTLELAPANASPSFLQALRDFGFTRLSIDSRSASKEELSTLVRQVRASGFASMSVDLFFGGKPSLAAWKTDLHRAVTLRVPHVTLHERASEGTQEDDERADHVAFAMTYLDAKGYEQYELTHFARPGHRSRYQEHVYAHGNVLGLGPGAESFWWPDRADPTRAERWANAPDLATYVERLRNNASPVSQREALNPPELTREYILLRLRTSDGLDLNVLEDRYGRSLRDRRAATLDRLAAEGLIHDDPDCVRLTPRGRLLADAVTRRLIRET